MTFLMSWYRIFYWMTVADNAKGLFITFIVIFTAISVIATFFFIFGRQDMDGDLSCPKDGTAERAKRWMWWSYPFMLLFWSLYVFTPSKKQSLLILAGGGTMKFLTTDSSAKEIPHELSTFVVTELKSMAKDAEVDLGLSSAKDKILDEAKKMTSEEIINKAKLDSNFAKVVLGR
jgi:hypothetical protein